MDLKDLTSLNCLQKWELDHQTEILKELKQALKQEAKNIKKNAHIIKRIH